MRPDQYVYFIKPVGMDGPIKIGCSHVPLQRLKVFQDWSPFELEVIGTVPGVIPDEKRIHHRYDIYRSHREWFHWSPEIHAAIQRILEIGFVPLNLRRPVNLWASQDQEAA